ncbi:MAG: hypothetical protein ACHQC8_06705 [Solirubrobacterales bacterium]
MTDHESANGGGCELPSDFEMPTAQEIELDLALGSASWQGLLGGREASAALGAADGHALRAAIPGRRLSRERRR